MADAVPPEQGALGRAELQEKAIRGAAWTLVHTLVSVPLAFAVNLVVARMLGVASYGRLAYLSMVMDVASGVVALGIGSALVQFGAKAHAAGRREEVRQLLSASQGFRLLVAAPLLSLMVVALVRVDLTFLLLAVAFGIWVPSALDGALACITIENKTAAGAKVAMVTNLLLQVGVVVALLWFGTADAVWSARLLAAGALVALALVPISPDYRRAVLRPALPRFPRAFMRYALPTGVAGLVSWLVLSRTEVFFLNWLSSAGAVGIFALAFGIAQHLFAPAQALIGPLIPAVSGLREVDLEAVAPAFLRTLRATSTVIGLVCAAALPLVSVLIPLLYGRPYRASAPILLVLGIGSGLLVAAGPVSAFVMARLSARRMLTASLFALAVDVGAAISLIPLWGTWGAVVANVGGAMTRLGILLVDEVRHLRLDARVVAHALLPVGAGAIACGLAWTAAEATPLAIVPLAIAAGALSVIVFVVLLRLTGSGLAHDDALVIARAAPKGTRRLARLTLRVLTVQPRG